MTVPKWLPGARMITSYRISWLRSDLVAGIVLCTLLVPQGMAYAELALSGVKTYPPAESLLLG